jgi:hypothetical protein
MECKFTVGQAVVCTTIENPPPGFSMYPFIGQDLGKLQADHVYTILSLETYYLPWLGDYVGVNLLEISHRVPYVHTRFRPATPDDLKEEFKKKKSKPKVLEDA